MLNEHIMSFLFGDVNIHSHHASSLTSKIVSSVCSFLFHCSSPCLLFDSRFSIFCILFLCVAVTSLVRCVVRMSCVVFVLFVLTCRVVFGVFCFVYGLFVSFCVCVCFLLVLLGARLMIINHCNGFHQARSMASCVCHIAIGSCRVVLLWRC